MEEKPWHIGSGSTPYYFQRGGAIVGSGPQIGVYNPHGFRALWNPNLPAQSNARAGSSAMEASHSNFGGGIDIGMPCGASMSEPVVKKKRGRPRKYGPDGQGQVSLHVRPKCFSLQDPMSPKRARGRPPGSGRKQQLALLGDWMNSSAGMAFSPHVIHIGEGEDDLARFRLIKTDNDVVEKMLSFAQQRPRALCILSATGTVSSVTIRQPPSSITFEGRFEILCLSGSYLVAEEGGSRNRTGGVSASLSSPDGHVVGGAIGTLIAAGSVQVVACSFVYDASKVKDKPIGRPKLNQDDTPQPSNDNRSSAPPPKSAFQAITAPSTMNVWPVQRSVDLRTDIDLTRG